MPTSSQPSRNAAVITTAGRLTSRMCPGVALWTLLIACAWVLVLSGVTRGETFYVNSRAGNDTNDGLSDSLLGAGNGPVATLSRAAELARGGDTIELMQTGEVYYDRVTLFGGRHSGVGAVPFRINGNGCIVSGAKPVPTNEWEMVDENVYRVTPVRKGHYQLILDSRVLAEVAVERGADELPALAPLQWCVWRGAVYLRAELGVHPRSLRLSLADQDVGLTLLDVRNVIVRDITFRHYRLDGVNAHDLCRDVVLENVTCEGNARAGLTVAGTSRVSAINCRLLGNRRHSLLVTERGDALVESSELDVEPTIVPLRRTKN